MLTISSHSQHACFSGTASPFDKEPWLSTWTSPWNGAAEDVVALRKASYQLYVRLPRLISMVRDLRAYPNGKSLRHANQLCEPLLSIRNDDAESGLLHEVQLEAAKNRPTCIIFPTFLAFQSCLWYWSLRLMVLRLHRYISTTASDFNHPQAPMSDEALRHVKNIMMSWDRGYDRPLMGSQRPMLPLPVLWGVTLDYVLPANMCGDHMQEWLVDRFGIYFPEMSACDRRAELASQADLMVGGEIKGRLAQRWRSNWKTIDPAT
jgi:hypothetical protein